jgi:hypothetical protein
MSFTLMSIYYCKKELKILKANTCNAVNTLAVSLHRKEKLSVRFLDQDDFLISNSACGQIVD